MSGSRVRAAIQRMARTDPAISDTIKAVSNRGAQAGATGVGQDDQDDRVCCDGSVSDNPNPGATQVDPDEGGQDASDGLDPNDPANLDMGAGSLTGLTDCATGEAVSFDGDGFAPPDGWDSPDEPPIDDSAVYGEFWYRDKSSGGDFSRTNLASGAYGVMRSIIAENNDFDPDSTYSLVGISFHSDVSATGTMLETDNQTGATNTFEFALSRTLCDGEAVDSCSDPDFVAYKELMWPDDGAVNLAIINGTIVGSKYDPENDGSYSKPLSEIELCDGNGNKIGIKPSASGGWKTINATTGEDGYLYDSSGQQIAHIDGNEYSDPSI